jgi:hypothetical protein
MEGLSGETFECLETWMLFPPPREGSIQSKPIRRPDATVRRLVAPGWQNNGNKQGSNSPNRENNKAFLKFSVDADQFSDIPHLQVFLSV